MSAEQDELLQQAVKAHKAGDSQAAERLYRSILEIDAVHPDANHNLGVLIVHTQDAKHALPYLKTALEANPKQMQYWLSAIDALIRADQIEAARSLLRQGQEKGLKGEQVDELVTRIEASQGSKTSGDSLPPEKMKEIRNLYNQGYHEVVIKAGNDLIKKFPNETTLMNIMGASNISLGAYELAIELFQRVIELKPDYAEAYNNLGAVYRDKGNLTEAIQTYKQGILIKSDFPEIHLNLGLALTEQRDFEGAIYNLNKAITLNSEFSEAHNNLGLVFKEQGRLEVALESYTRAIKTNPNYKGAWNNIFFVIRSLNLSENTKLELYDKKLKKASLNNDDYNILQHKLASFQPHLADTSFEDVIDTISANSDDEVTNPQSPDQSGITPTVPGKMIALLHFGRSGTGLFHSLIDNHSEISTLPSIYFSEYFDADNWKKLTANGWDQVPESFVSQYEVLFDASSSVPVSTINKEKWNLGVDEGMANVGENRDEVLTVDRDIFCSELRRLMSSYPKLDPSTFFTLVHVAYEAALNNPSDKHTILYHIHNPTDYTKLNFLRYRPDTRFVMMVREPVQSCESWIKRQWDEGDYKEVSNAIIQMLFDIDQIVFRKCDSVGVRLEDLKLHPEETISSLCDWMGIKEEPGLYEMTAQGQKWWGDPSSVDYSEAGMSPFDDKSIKRKIGSIFSDRDQFILRTFFYPFSVRFGYVEEDVAGFRRDLTEVKPMLEELFDFEKQVASDRDIDLDMYKKSVSYLYLRAGLLDRWKVLNEFSDYPHMLTPLKIGLNT
jgi:tetratricopeptide (TPR) repeat protein